MTDGRTDERTPQRTLFGHPIGLVNLFGVELWERLYYSITDGGLGLPQSTATGIVGAYGGPGLPVDRARRLGQQARGGRALTPRFGD
jgi:hypothetical protein